MLVSRVLCLSALFVPFACLCATADADPMVRKRMLTHIPPDETKEGASSAFRNIRKNAQLGSEHNARVKEDALPAAMLELGEASASSGQAWPLTDSGTCLVNDGFKDNVQAVINTDPFGGESTLKVNETVLKEKEADVVLKLGISQRELSKAITLDKDILECYEQEKILLQDWESYGCANVPQKPDCYANSKFTWWPACTSELCLTDEQTCSFAGNRSWSNCYNWYLHQAEKKKEVLFAKFEEYKTAMKSCRASEVTHADTVGNCTAKQQALDAKKQVCASKDAAAKAQACALEKALEAQCTAVGQVKTFIDAFNKKISFFAPAHDAWGIVQCMLHGFKGAGVFAESDWSRCTGNATQATELIAAKDVPQPPAGPGDFTCGLGGSLTLSGFIWATGSFSDTYVKAPAKLKASAAGELVLDTKIPALAHMPVCELQARSVR